MCEKVNLLLQVKSVTIRERELPRENDWSATIGNDAAPIIRGGLVIYSPGQTCFGDFSIATFHATPPQSSRHYTLPYFSLSSLSLSSLSLPKSELQNQRRRWSSFEDHIGASNTYPSRTFYPRPISPTSILLHRHRSASLASICNTSRIGWRSELWKRCWRNTLFDYVVVRKWSSSPSGVTTSRRQDRRSQINLDLLLIL